MTVRAHHKYIYLAGELARVNLAKIIMSFSDEKKVITEAVLDLVNTTTTKVHAV